MGEWTFGESTFEVWEHSRRVEPTTADIDCFFAEVHSGGFEEDEQIIRDGETYWIARGEKMREVEQVEVLVPSYEDTEYLYVPVKPAQMVDAAIFWRDLLFLVALYAARQPSVSPAPSQQEKPQANVHPTDAKEAAAQETPATGQAVSHQAKDGYPLAQCL